MFPLLTLLLCSDTIFSMLGMVLVELLSPYNIEGLVWKSKYYNYNDIFSLRAVICNHAIQ